MSTTSISGRDPSTGHSIRVLVEEGRIAGIEPAAGPERAWLGPGLIDLQINGYRGHDLNRPGVDAAEVSWLARAVAESGVTRFAPTLITAPEPQLLSALRAIAAACEEDPLVRRMVAFVHVEGPHLSPEDGPRGAHPLAAIRPPDLAELERWQADSGGRVGLVTLSPHWPATAAYVRALVARGIVVAIGHTHAAEAEIAAAVAAGATLSTHLGNGAHAVLPRHPNYIWSQLAEDRLMASFIADGHHLPAAALKAMLRAKGPERCLLVSDAVALAGMPPGIYDTPVGGRVELSATKRLGVAGTPYLAGAAKSLAEGVAGTVAMTGLDLGQALRLATLNPGRLAGGGKLAPGEPADLLRFTWQEGDSGLGIDTVLLAGGAIR